MEELGELDLSTSILIKLGNHLIDSLSLCLNPQRVNGNFEFYINHVLPLGSMAPPRSRSNKSKAFLI